VEEILGVVKEVPVARLEPPVADAYQLMVPADADAPRVTVPVPHTLPGEVDVIDGTVFTARVYVSVAGAQGAPKGLLVIIVMITVLPMSPAAGV
jgi:hypothetical protein